MGAPKPAADRDPEEVIAAAEATHDLILDGGPFDDEACATIAANQEAWFDMWCTAMRGESEAAHG